MKPTRVGVMVLLFIGGLTLAVFPGGGFGGVYMRDYMSRYRAEIRSAETAVKAYQADWGVYPRPGAGHRLPARVMKLPPRDGQDLFAMYEYREKLVSKILGGLFWPLLVAVPIVAAAVVWRKRDEWSFGDKVAAFVWAGFGLFYFFCLGSWIVGPSSDMLYLRPGVDRTNPIMFRYYTDGTTGWMLLGVGPDGKEDYHPPENLKFETSTMIESLLPFTYDPTNGTVSSGDIWRVSQ